MRVKSTHRRASNANKHDGAHSHTRQRRARCCVKVNCRRDSSIFDAFLVLVIMNWRQATANVSPIAAAVSAYSRNELDLLTHLRAYLRAINPQLFSLSVSLFEIHKQSIRPIYINDLLGQRQVSDSESTKFPLLSCSHRRQSVGDGGTWSPQYFAGGDCPSQ